MFNYFDFNNAINFIQWLSTYSFTNAPSIKDYIGG